MIPLPGLSQPNPFEPVEGRRVVLTAAEFDALIAEAEARDDDEA